jgi:hypothetical protein
MVNKNQNISVFLRKLTFQIQVHKLPKIFFLQLSIYRDLNTTQEILYCTYTCTYCSLICIPLKFVQSHM